ncbi:pilus assembly protein TadG-related protein [Aureimonas leprariae]|uniref:Flp pilus-assembly TadG-like N-terminal domain-containing protein n=1 Tax=Plantimonas leprariae TaxID=2615207 RepID=A0A7V7PRD0_9HYPH|nr:pilus assembly protein TadG-related protein [Aureimonas leprariae]KAB0681268.1 hypothetical protein F6X38_05085 [Aureimonas leprariae]
MTAALRRFTVARNGSALVGFALALPVLLGAAAFGVDTGVLFLERRALQKAVDAAALAAVLQPSGEAPGVVRRVMAANGAADAAFELRFGRWEGDRGRDPDARFGHAGEVNAVSLEASRRVPTLFARIFGQLEKPIGARARAVALPAVSFALGSRLASVDPPLADAVLEPLVGSGLGLTVMDYRDLARSTVRTDGFLRMLAGATGLPSSSRAREVLARPVSLSVMLSVAAGELARDGDRAGAATMRKASRHVADGAATVVPADLLGLDPDFADLRLDYPNRALAARLSVLSLLSAALTERGIGNAATARFGLPGIAEAKALLLLGEAESGARALSLGGAAASAETAQLKARLLLTAGAGVAGATLDVPVELVAAGARAEVVAATCSADPAKREVKLAVQPGVVRLSLGNSSPTLGELSITGKPLPARLVDAPLVTVEGSATATLRQTAPTVVSFRGAEIGSGATKTVRTRTLASSLVAGLFDDADLHVRAGALGLAFPLAAAPVRAALATLAEPTDEVLDALLAVAGIGLGEADVRVDDLVCSNARIVG